MVLKPPCKLRPIMPLMRGLAEEHKTQHLRHCLASELPNALREAFKFPSRACPQKAQPPSKACSSQMSALKEIALAFPLTALTQLPRPSARVGLSALPRAILRARSPFLFQHHPVGPFLSECSHGRVMVFLNPPPAIRPTTRARAGGGTPGESSRGSLGSLGSWRL